MRFYYYWLFLDNEINKGSLCFVLSFFGQRTWIAIIFLSSVDVNQEELMEQTMSYSSHLAS